jgi:3-hydroxy acid dehydrogenase/malonic semialdehyde reductase
MGRVDLLCGGDPHGNVTPMPGKTILITGVTGGFGAAMARKFGASGWNLILQARNADRLNDIIATIPDAASITPVLFDLRDDAALDAAFEKLPPFAVLVNNAGLALGLEPAQRADLDDWDEMIATNIRALTRITRLSLPQMVERGSGHIINIGSIAGTYPYAGGNVYGATKAFVQQFSLNLRADLHGTNVRVSNIEPGLAQTNFSRTRFKGDAEKADSVYEGTHPLTGDDIAEAVYWTASLPPHININTMEIMPTCQSFAGLQIHRATAKGTTT